MSSNHIRYFRFQEYQLDVAQSVLFKAGHSLPLTHKAVQLLTVLIERRGQTVPKSQLFELVWPQTHVADASLTQNIYLLRKFIGDKAIITVPKRGYRFALEVEEVYDEDATAGQEVPEPPPAELTGGDAQPTRFLSRALRVAFKRRPEAGPIFKPARLLVLSLPAALIVVSSLIYLKTSESGVTPGRSGRDANSVAVLPFKTIGFSAEQDYLSLGMADVIITKLSRLRNLNVRPTSVIYRYTDRPFDPVSVGRELGVENVLDGSVQREGERIRVSVRLVRVAGGETVWAEVFDRDYSGVFGLQDAIAQRVALKLGVEPDEGERQLMTKHHTENLGAYQDYVRGLYFCNKRTEDGFRKCIEYLNQSVAKDPNYALAHAGLADAYALVAIWGYNLLPEREAYEKAKAEALKSVELDETLAEAHAALFLVRDSYEKNPAEAEKEIRRAIELSPNTAPIHHRYGIFLQDRLDLEGAYDEMIIARRLDPVSPQINLNLCYLNFLRGRRDEALGHCRDTLELAPNHPRVKIIMGVIFTEEKKYDEAIKVLEEAQPETPTAWRGYLGYAYAKAGRKSEARRVLASLEEVKGPPPVGYYYAKAIVHAGLGDNTQAIRLLKLEKRDWDTWCVLLKYDPQLSAVRPSPDFGAMLKECLDRFASAR